MHKVLGSILSNRQKHKQQVREEKPSKKSQKERFDRKRISKNFITEAEDEPQDGFILEGETTIVMLVCGPPKDHSR